MKNLKDYLTEGQNFLVNRKLKNRQQQYEYHPTTRDELTNIIIELLKNDITDLNCIDVSKVTDMSYLFYEVNNKITVKEIDISEWDVSNVVNMHAMFYNCNKFNADLSKWQTDNVKYMNSMFGGCAEFNSNLSNWNTHNVIYMACMFWECKKFNYDLSKWTVTTLNINNMFKNCDTLEKNNKIPAWYKN